MLEFLLAGQNIPFATAMVLVAIIGIFEGAALVLGVGLGEVLDSFIPDFELDVDVEVGEVGSQNALSRLLGWLKVGKVPILMLLVVFLFSFAFVGYLLNFMASSAFGPMLPGLVTIPLSIAGALPFTRAGAAVLEVIMPKDETSAVSLDSLIGRIATITIGNATGDMSAEARVKDAHGASHYIRVRPEEGHGPFTTEQPLLLVRKEGSEFVVIAADTAVSQSQ